MIDNYEHYITKNIRAFYKRRLFSPIVYCILLLLLFFIFPMYNLLNPTKIGEDKGFADSYYSRNKCVETNLSNLYFTGYTKESSYGTKGYYYYCMHNDECIIVLLSPSTCDEGMPMIVSLPLKGRLMKGQENYITLIDNLSKDITWTSRGLESAMPSYYLSEIDYNKTFVVVFFLFYFGTLAYSGFSIIAYLLFIKFPFLSPTCQNLIVFGHPRKMLEEAEEELATLPQLATEDMFITEHYFILTSPYGNAVVPINEIIWIYKYSTLHKFLWYHFSISYTLYISANKHLYIHCPKNTKSDIDGIMDYLAEANHNILVGFNEENRLKVQKKQGKPLHVERLYALLRRKI